MKTNRSTTIAFLTFFFLVFLASCLSRNLLLSLLGETLDKFLINIVWISTMLFFFTCTSVFLICLLRIPEVSDMVFIPCVTATGICIWLLIFRILFKLLPEDLPFNFWTFIIGMPIMVLALPSLFLFIVYIRKLLNYIVADKTSPPSSPPDSSSKSGKKQLFDGARDGDIEKVRDSAGLTTRMTAVNNNEQEIGKVLDEETLETIKANQQMERKSYYLGVNSIDAAVEAIGSLSFFTVIDKKSAQFKYAHEGRMSVGILPIKDPVGAVFFVTGTFTTEEMSEIEALAKHEYAPLSEAVSDVVAQTMLDLDKKGLRMTHQILGKGENPNKGLGGLKCNVNNSFEECPADKKTAPIKEPVFFKNVQDGNKTYELYLEDDAEIAKTWLLTKKVEKSQYYISVKTQQGTWGMDKEGLYLTDLLPWQTDLSRAQVEGSVIGIPSMFSLSNAKRGIADNFVVQVQCGKDGCSGLWHDALRYRNKTLVRCPKCSSYNVIDSSNIVYLEG